MPSDILHNEEKNLKLINFNLLEQKLHIVNYIAG